MAAYRCRAPSASSSPPRSTLTGIAPCYPTRSRCRCCSRCSSKQTRRRWERHWARQGRSSCRAIARLFSCSLDAVLVRCRCSPDV
eukprot:3516652-Pleurochrysis_carterae.AAC.1